ncbi:MAG TPA: fasciclin domain-containing protein [Jiangellaceae bacterium]|nr:fasciclin domain-containing protein [Jiangellaceae bacterium]
MLRLLTPRRAAVVGVLGMALLGAACSSNNGGTSGSQTPAASPTTASPMTASGPFGAACSAVPASGAGSLEGMARDPVATAASNNPELSTLVTAVRKAGLVDTLNSANGITVFAPINDAFSALPKPTLDKALGEPKGLLTTVLTYHVVQGQLAPDQLAGTHKTLQGGTLEVSGSGEDFKVNGDSRVICGNVQTANATVYLIDQVLLPKS